MFTEVVIERILLMALVLLPLFINAQLSEDEAVKANNPLADAKALNLQNYYVPAVYDDANVKPNTTLIRFAMPLHHGKVLMRFTLPLGTTPTGYDNNGKSLYSSGLGDASFFATYTLSKPGAKILYGVGPQFVFPTASNNYTGAGKWQVGAAFICFDTRSPVFQRGALITYQVSVAGQSDRADVSLLAVQPFLLFQLGKGAYLRSSGIWNFNINADAYNVPLGIGAGHVVKAGNVVFNLFLEPQFTMLHAGNAQPAIQIFSGINAQF